jgi:amino acid adenylation domain-containing protein
MALDRISASQNLEPNDGAFGWDDSDLERSITDRFERMVRRYPHRPAVKTHEQELTYDQLNQAANRLARRIVTAQGTRSEPVAILMKQGAGMIVAILGALKAGKVYVPLDPSNSTERLQSILADSQAKCIVTDDPHKVHRVGCAQILDFNELDAHICPDDLGLTPTSDALLAIIYTSGSTGVPKGVLEDHKYILRIIRAYSENVDICARDKLILLFSLTSNAAHANLFGALLNGAAVHCLDPKKRHITRLATWLTQEKTTIYHSSASFFRKFAETLRNGEQFPDVRVVQLSAEPVLARDLELCRRHFAPECIFINSFATTEVGPVLQYRLALGTPFTEHVLPVGFPTKGLRVGLVDDDGRPVAPNTTGQLVVQSRYLSLGYWEKPELTVTKFLPDPEGADQRLYFTGDLARMAADGCFFHVGRKDFQVKIRGYRVNTGDVEMMILSHPGIKQVAIVSQPGNNNEVCLEAYYVAAQDAALTAAKLRAYLRERLPEYMIPSVFVELDFLPTAASGKVDRGALASLNGVKPESETSFVAPRTVVEEELATVWMNVLGTERVGVHDNFLDLGGHSLSAFQIIARVREIFAVDLSIQFFIDVDSATVASMAELIEQVYRRHKEQFI